MKSTWERQEEARRLLELACHAFESGRIKDAASIFERSAAGGSNEAKVNLGNILSEGVDVERNLARAKNLYRSAYKGGCAYGATVLGVQYKNEGKHRLAILWLEKAAQMGEEWAMEYLREYRGQRG